MSGCSCERGPIAVIAALREELEPLYQRMGGTTKLISGNVAKTVHHERPYLWLITGMGRQQTRKRLMQAQEFLKEAQLLVMIGVCGGLDPLLGSTQIFIPQTISVDSDDYAVNLILRALPPEITFRQDVSVGGVLRTIDHVMGKEEKRTIYQEKQYRAVDMEAGEIARWCAEATKHCMIIKSVSDPVDFPLPPETYIQKSWHARGLKRWVLWLSHPWYEWHMFQLRRLCMRSIEKVTMYMYMILEAL